MPKNWADKCTELNKYHDNSILDVLVDALLK